MTMYSSTLVLQYSIPRTQKHTEQSEQTWCVNNSTHCVLVLDSIIIMFFFRRKSQLSCRCYKQIQIQIYMCVIRHGFRLFQPLESKGTPCRIFFCFMKHYAIMRHSNHSIQPYYDFNCFFTLFKNKGNANFLCKLQARPTTDEQKPFFQ